MASTEHTTQVQGLTFTFVPADVNGASSSAILSLDEADQDTLATIEQATSPAQGTGTPTSPTFPLAATFEDNYASALHIVTKSRVSDPSSVEHILVHADLLAPSPSPAAKTPKARSSPSFNSLRFRSRILIPTSSRKRPTFLSLLPLALPLRRPLASFGQGRRGH